MRPLILSEFLINLIRSIFTLGAGALFYKATGELWALTAALLTETLAILFIQGIAGATVDKVGVKKVYLVSMSLFNILMFGVIVSQIDIIGDAYLLFITLTVFNIIFPFIRTSTFVALKLLATKSELEKVNGKLAISIQSGQIVGMTLVGVAMQFDLYHLLIYAISLSSVLCLLCYFKLPHTLFSPGGARAAGRESKSRSFINILQQLHSFLSEQKTIILLCVFASMDFTLIALFNLLLAPAVEFQFFGNEIWLAILDITFAAGCIFGAHYVTKKVDGLGFRIDMTIFSIVSAGALFLSYLFSFPSYVIMFFTFIFGTFCAISSIIWNAELQKAAPPGILGKLSSLRFMIAAIFVTTATSLVSKSNEVNFSEATKMACFIAVALVLLTCSLYSFRRTDGHIQIQNDSV
jgi:MFS family permease